MGGDVETLFPPNSIVVLPPHLVEQQRPLTDFGFVAMVLRFNSTLNVQGAIVSRDLNTASALPHKTILVMRATALLWYTLATTSDTSHIDEAVSARYEQGLCCAFDVETSTPCTLRGRSAVGHGYVLCDHHASQCANAAPPITPPSSEFLLRRVVQTLTGEHS
jgi:hypothetical protein